EATQTLYRFFWSEYCDWYVEASKAVLHGTDAARKENVLAVLDFVLSHTLRLFHPFLPFITEELWHGMGYHEDMPAGQGGKTIMQAPWPKPLDQDFRDHYGLDDYSLQFVDTKYELVSLGRNLRREGNLPASKKVTFVLKPAEPLAPHDTEVLKILLNAESLKVQADYQPSKGTPVVHSKLGELYLPMEGLVDVGAERARLNRELQKIEAEIAKAEQRLANPAFAQKAPPHVLQEHRQRLAEWQAKHDQVKAALDRLG
ncbi:MAG TPA: class I tRNA ligase family protein, partial [Candidatus Paceibacterota bacterium]|nr:class I tRNA ligase family protein [Candidatus Paceibacterota bacterium]